MTWSKVWNYRLEAALGALIALLIGCRFSDWLSGPLRHIRDPLTLVFVVLIVVVLHRLYRKKWRKWVVAGVQKLFASGTRRLLRFMERWSSALKKKTVIHGGTQVIFHQANGSAKAKTHKRHPRWKHLQSERARMRYLYRHMITERIRHGAHIRPTDTPAEIEHAGENSEADRVVFELYNRYRYDERKEIDKSMVESIKDTHFKDLK